jgi:membrane protease YdiL (CAAX protease family)
LLERSNSTVAATVVSSALFGVWHALPSLGLAANNEAISGAIGQDRSALAGVVFCEPRRRNGSTLASARPH